MARGAARLAKADVSVSVTGLAGPKGERIISDNYVISMLEMKKFYEQIHRRKRSKAFWTADSLTFARLPSNIYFFTVIFSWIQHGCYQKQELNKDSIVTATVTPTSPPVPSLVEEIGISVTELSIYSLALNHKDIESVTALVSSKEITPEVIVDKVVESMEDASFQIKSSRTASYDCNCSHTVIKSFLNM